MAATDSRFTPASAEHWRESYEDYYRRTNRSPHEFAKAMVHGLTNDPVMLYGFIMDAISDTTEAERWHG